MTAAYEPISVEDAGKAGPDIHTTAGKLADLLRRSAQLADSPAAVERQRAKGRQTARERVEALLDPGSFVEFDELVRHRSTNFGMQEKRPYGDGVITGTGTVDGRNVAVFSQDATVFGGSLGEVYGQKIVKVMDFALKTGIPMIGINDGGGARIQEGVVALGLYGEIFMRNVRSSGVIPQISLIMGPCAGGAVYSPAISDFTVMVDQTSHMFITGPDVIKTVTGEDVEMEDLGGGRAHNTKSGVAHYLAANETDAMSLRQGAAELPAEQQPLRTAVVPRRRADRGVDRRLARRHRPRARLGHPGLAANQPYDMHEVINRVLDDGEFLEVHALFAPNIIVGFGRIEGRSVGVVANQPTQFAGCLDIDASEKAARFVRTCDAFNVPVLTFVDVPGFLPGHRPGVGRHHPPRRQADLRLRRGDGPEGHRDHPQGLRRGLRRHGLQAPRRRHQHRLADGADRRHRRGGRGEHPLPQGAQGPHR